MNIKSNLAHSSVILKGHVNRYAFLGLLISVGSILIASCIVSYQLTGSVSLGGFIQAQRSNPAIWILDLTPFMFVYWGQAFCYGLVNKAESLLVDKTKELLNISGNLELKLKYESNHDSLTNLPNNRLLNEKIRLAIEQLGAQGELAVIVIKINDLNYNFSSFNANNIVKQFAEKLKSILIDPYMLKASLGINMVARLQSDEFAILMPRLKKDLDINELLIHLLTLLNNNLMVDGISINVTSTVGAAIYPVHGEEDDVLVNHAIIAVYQARKGNKSYAIYSPEMEEDLIQNQMVMNELQRSIENKDLKIYYQPIVELANGQIVGAESSARFEHPELGLLSAEKFMPLIEGTNLIHNLTTLMLKQVIKQLAAWHDAGHKIFVSVNLSVHHELPELIEKLLNDYEIAPQFLKLEFTERACLTEQMVTKEVFDRLSAMGIKLWIDDFCSENSSFIQLTNFPIENIKIEKSFVLKIAKDAKKAKIVEAIVKLAQTLGWEPLADGIADQNALEKLRDLGCLYGQGLYFSRAVNVAEFTSLLKK
ncbi:putative bifunctional diguanylate cyclase/phosphodiesterase [Legionella pneumophila]|uniref:putative bifunctional diguanylate cyclase/phosphodiesterase n=1 Tax=Legionella pneumophila TaxID=446 RepID=UPI00101324BB|nr:bifunctional diguanylate cyclase/phosphodiesterase [Legionella pneumophila]MCW8406512.1 bifunctional diguanylate cyclase/phosphodiesterase [Legionella pneumophila]RYB35666.1 bifunctional diguanylate cyclase/phosphodiesterase [Legionella pneumophila]RYB42939.1 bifunctional diguanylate cyclase/phosphodiesterase [Legionella pneumophila]RYB71525.1 bifunctional diguanylate cyclase/phosphodiesterase [Legionella pneumophila]RYB72918.1 bifunctional diguanylate cyclase/phosphodiesterase [Legionella 